MEGSTPQPSGQKAAPSQSEQSGGQPASPSLPATPSTRRREKSVAEPDERPLLDIDETEVEAQAVAVEDPTPAILDSVTYGTAAIPVYGVEPVWNKYDPSAEPNRPLDPDHAEKLSQNMLANLRIADAANRICITMSENEIELSVRHTAVHTLYPRSIKWYNEHRHEKEVLAKVAAKQKEISERIRKKARANKRAFITTEY
jgi:hypothetical protein